MNMLNKLFGYKVSKLKKVINFLILVVLMAILAMGIKETIGREWVVLCDLIIILVFGVIVYGEGRAYERAKTKKKV